MTAQAPVMLDEDCFEAGYAMACLLTPATCLLVRADLTLCLDDGNAHADDQRRARLILEGMDSAEADKKGSKQ